MKYAIILLFAFCLSVAGKAQLVVKATCGTVTVDIIDGKVNGLKPDARYIEIKEKLPCFTETEPEGTTAKCGASIFYKDRDIYFYTDRDYIEIKEKCTAKFSTPILGLPRTGLFKILGNPKLKDDTWDAYQMAYGTLVLHYNKAGKVNLLQFSTKPAELLSLCTL